MARHKKHHGGKKLKVMGAHLGGKHHKGKRGRKRGRRK
jgi:hypothetical protein